MSDQQPKKFSYPNAFRYGCAYGFTIQLFTHLCTKEPLAARPFSYLTVPLFFGFAHSYWDWWRRCATQEVMYGEDEASYHNQIRALNNCRIGEESETQNLVEYLTGSTTRL
tara:strand:+ start:75 stop:407 length:333 start_codon:yes stop_codon:yes gene_type:complete